MKYLLRYKLFLLLLLIISCSQSNVEEKPTLSVKDNIIKDSIHRIFIPIPKMEKSCTCDSNDVKKLVQQKSFNSVAEYDAKSFSESKFYELDSQANRKLWFRDIENPTQTKFTQLWNAYRDQNYYADPLDFLEFYKNRNDVQLAFIFGPNDDLWAYNIFVVKKIKCCYLITRSYYRHNRFTYKAFSVFDSNTFINLFSTINRINITPLEVKKAYGYSGYFVDNLSSNKFIIDFKNEVVKFQDSSNLYKTIPKPEIIKLYNFLDHDIHWIPTYGE